MTFVLSVPSPALADAVSDLADRVDIVVWAMDGPAPRDRIDVVVPPYMNAGKIYPRLVGLETQLVQSQSIGYDGISDLLPAGHRFANATSVHETSTAELAVALTLASQRHLPDFVRAQGEGRWTHIFAQSLADRRVLLLGYGGVGKAIAARLAPFEVSMRAVASRARNEDGMAVHAVSELGTLLPETDIVIASLPGGEGTRHIIDDAFLDALPDGALVVNVGRGPLVDTEALVRHAAAGRIRAALDVTDPEPLPEGHPLWHTPGILISPHVGGASTAMQPRIANLVRTQVERLLVGDEPVNVVIDAR